MVFWIAGTIFGEGGAAVAVFAGALAGRKEEGEEAVTPGAVTWVTGCCDGRWIGGLVDYWIGGSGGGR